ncbi:MAG TPA: hypothetical protein VKI44_32265 [Acetobacteraceae bacterium]|nr:hypothetical protein [Acetobacteraceae bacterium]
MNQATPAPELARIRDAVARYPVSRSWLYREAAAGRVRLVRMGTRTTLVDLASVRDVLASLPDAPIRKAKAAV